MEKIQCGIVLLFRIFETSVLSICGANQVFFILCHTCICMGIIKEGDISLGFIMISGVRHIVLKIEFHVKLRSLNYTNN